MARVIVCLSTLCGGVPRCCSGNRDDEEKLRNNEPDLEREKQELQDEEPDLDRENQGLQDEEPDLDREKQELQDEEPDLEREKQEVQNDVEKLKKTHERICALLTDAEEMKIWRESVKLWLRELKDLAYDAEDLIEEYEYELRHAEVEEIEELNNGCPVAEPEEGRLTYQVCHSLVSVAAIVDFRKKIEMINERYDKIVIEGQSLINLEGERVHDPPSVQRATGSLLSEPRIYGREEDRCKILNSLMSDAPVTDGVPTVAIVGMGGLGKTTLAQLLYNDNEVCRCFPVRGWVHVSQDFDVIKLARSIIQSFTHKPCDLTELSPLQASLIAAVKENKFLLVLDDVWGVDDSLCNNILTALRFGSSGSRVLMTTRDERVASRMNLITLHRLGGLSDNDCWQLFLRHAFRSDSVNTMPHMQLNMEDIRANVVEKCRGLPLAARALGGILRFEHDRSRWMHVLESDLWKEDRDKDNGVLGVLKLSYIYLPAHLKRCFGYCSVFPKGYIMSKEELVYMWMAFGLVQDRNGKSAFGLGLDHIDQLVSRSVLQTTKDSQMKDVVFMHDLVHDLAQNILGVECVKMENSSKHPSNPTALYCVAPESKRARVFIDYPSYITDFAGSCLAGMFVHLKSLRALILQDYFIYELPNSIVELKHLRYLDLRNCSWLRKLPEAVCRLYNLQAIRSPRHAKLPINIKNLINLQYLEVSDYQPLPPGIGRLSKLKHLSDFVVGIDTEKHASIEELKILNNLQGKLAIYFIDSVISSEDAGAAPLKDKEHIVTLELKWKRFQPSEDTDPERVSEALQPHVNLVNLEIRNYGGPNLPNWLGHPSFEKLAVLTLCSCQMCPNLPSLGQLPCLRSLYIDGLRSVKRVGSEFYYYNGPRCGIPCKSQGITDNMVKSFPSLVVLKLSNMKQLEEWGSCGVDEDESFCQFPSLAQLSIEHCPRLTVILPAFPALAALELGSCPMLKSLPTMPLVHTLGLGGLLEEELLSTVALPKLKTLKLTSIEGVKTISLYSRFPALEYVEINWSSDSCLPTCTQLNLSSQNHGVQQL